MGDKNWKNLMALLRQLTWYLAILDRVTYEATKHIKIQ